MFIVLTILFLGVLHEDTPLYFKVKRNKVDLPCDDSVVDLYLWSVALLAEHGFEQYEVSNFALPGFQSRHNSVYWDRKPYKGFGLGACSFDGARRLQNEKNLMSYMSAIENDKEVTSFVEELLPQQVRLEKIMLGLRRSAGIAFKDMCEDLTNEEQEQLKQRVAWLIEHKFVQKNDDMLVLTPAALALENEIVLKLSL